MSRREKYESGGKKKMRRREKYESGGKSVKEGMDVERMALNTEAKKERK